MAPCRQARAARAPRIDLHADPGLPDDTRLWAALQDVSGGAWGGTVYDVDAILPVIEAGRRALAEEALRSGSEQPHAAGRGR